MLTLTPQSFYEFDIAALLGAVQKYGIFNLIGWL